MFWKTTFAARYGNWAIGINSVRRYCEPQSKLWLPSVSALMPSMFSVIMVGLSPKKLEIGGVAPTESPPASVITPSLASADTVEPGFQVGCAADCSTTGC